MQYGGKIVTSGLVLALDAGSKKSYPGTGTIWFDRSGNNFNGTLTNGPTFSSANGGAIVFDGTNDYGSLSINLSSYSQITTEIWLKLSITTGVMAFEHSANWNTNAGGFGVYPNNTGFVDDSTICHTNYRIDGSTNLARNYAFTCGTTNYSCHVNIFSNIVDSTGRLTYVNGNLLSYSSVGGFATGTSTTAGSAFRNDTLYLASRGGTGAFLNGNIAILKIYNRKLSASEVLQNFTATRARFGL